MEAKSINNYKCPACGGGLNFNPASGKIVCEYCDSSYTVEQIEEIYKPTQTNGDPEDETNSNEDPELSEEQYTSGDAHWNTDELNSNWGEESGNMKEYNCPSCGANLICEATTAATSCPYCGNPTIIETQFAGSLRPDYCIPFKIKKEDAINNLKNFYKKKFLLPKLFSDQNHLEEIKGIYVPFWLFDGTSEGTVNFKTSSSTTIRHGNKETTTTRYFDCIRSGKIDFTKIPVDASEKMPDDMMDSLEPFNYDEMKEFSTAYLPGYLADKYDVTVDQCSSRAHSRCAKTFVDAMEDTVTGYDTCKITGTNISIKNGKVHYALIPVYLLYTKWNEQKFLFAVNGQTGKVVGNLPISKGRSFLFFLINFLIGIGIGAAVAAIAMLLIKWFAD